MSTWLYLDFPGDYKSIYSMNLRAARPDLMNELNELPLTDGCAVYITRENDLHELWKVKTAEIEG